MQTTKRGIADMYRAIDELDFSQIKAKLMHRRDGVIALRQVERAEAGYRQFLKLAAKHPDAPIVPSEEVDEFWHMHILDTQRYSADCERIFGYMIHHNPYIGINGAEDEARLFALAAASNELAEHEFGEGAYCVKPEAKGDAAAYCVKPEAKADAPAYCVKPEAKADAPAYCVKPEAKADAAAYCVKPEAKGDAAAYCVKPEAKADAPAYCVKPEAKADAAAYCVKPEAKADAAAYCVKPEAKGSAAAYCVKPEAKGDAIAYCVKPEAKSNVAAYCVRPEAIARRPVAALMLQRGA
ncbi:glycine-rich domain-containing protein [Trinickia acidisoli]|uniref:glycine-rich domain-containing protein n=1 Tax=Trinickia acidisoli TaxID=2767482 RepID=UPI001A904300|nr:hypothetical protein [Trinickia acidisoli]